MKPTKSALYVFGLLALIYTLAFLFSGCQSVRHQERSGCYASKRMSGYGPGGYSYRTHTTKRQSF